MNRELTSDHIIGTFSTEHYVNGSQLAFGENYANYPSRSEYGKVLFLVYKGSLRQFRIIDCTVFPFNYGIRAHDSRSIYRNVTTIEVAGIGKLYIGNKMYGGNFDFKIYESVEDYDNNKEYKMKYTSISKECCAKRFGVEFIHLSILEDNVVRRWFWNGTSPELRPVYEQMPICYHVDKDGISFPDGWCQEDLDGYPTKEACRADNEVSVCCFDEPKKFSIRAAETRSRTFEFYTGSYEEALALAKKELEANPLNEEDSDGLFFS